MLDVADLLDWSYGHNTAFEKNTSYEGKLWLLDGTPYDKVNLF